jgi:Cys-rich four helix bundle protein (predicted Tat secretion target)
MTTRRDFITTTGTGVAAAAFLAATEGRAAPAAAPPRDKDASADVADTASACLRTGEACVAHCTEELGKGNTSMASCNKRVHEMLAMTRAMQTLAASKSEFAKRHAAVCADVCKTCAAACLEHKEHWGHGMHMACKACYDACVACELSCRKLAA